MSNNRGPVRMDHGKVLKVFLTNHGLLYLGRGNKKDYVIIKSNYGIHNMRVCSLKKGGLPTICTAINKEEYFIKKAIEVHGNKYDYSKMVYKNSKILIELICKEHGVFWQNPSIHLGGRGCKKCGYNLVSQSRINGICGWGLSDWISLAKNSKNFDSYKLYILKCWDKQESFIKIGRTFQTIKKRFKQKTHLPYKYEVLYKIIDNPEYIFKLENILKNKYKENKYIPNKKFNGMYECFKIDEISV